MNTPESPRNPGSPRRRPPRTATPEGRPTTTTSEASQSRIRPTVTGSTGVSFAVIPHQTGGRTILSVLIVLALLLTLLGVGSWYYVSQFNGSITSVDVPNGKGSKDGATDILLVGLDSRRDAKGNPLSQEELDMLRAGDDDVSNTDTIMVMRVPDDGKSATAISIPRDTWVSTPELGSLKINGVLPQTKNLVSQQMLDAGETDMDLIDAQATQAGRDALFEVIKELTGVELDHYAEVGLLGFVLLTDAIGGVDVCLLEPVDEPLSGAQFPAGEQTLSGQDALSFVRQRHDLPRGDFDRVARQQAYLASMASKALSSQVLTNPSSMSAIQQAVERSLIIDSGWDIMKMAQQFSDISGSEVKFLTIPVTSIDGMSEDGQSIVTVDPDQVKAFFKDLLGTVEENPEPKEELGPIQDFNAHDYTVNVHNASSIQGLASSVGDTIASAGYTIGDVGNYEGTSVSLSQINVADKSDPAARTLAIQLGGLDIVEDKNLEPHTINLTLSNSYKGVGLYGPEELAPLMASAVDAAERGELPYEDNQGAEGVANYEDPEIAEAKENEINAGGNGPNCVY